MYCVSVVYVLPTWRAVPRLQGVLCGGLVLSVCVGKETKDIYGTLPCHSLYCRFVRQGGYDSVRWKANRASGTAVQKQRRNRLGCVVPVPIPPLWCMPRCGRCAFRLQSQARSVRMAFMTHSTITPTSAKTAMPIVASPRLASTSTSVLTAMAKTTF